jgi:hypothetical protein
MSRVRMFRMRTFRSLLLVATLLVAVLVGSPSSAAPEPLDMAIVHVEGAGQVARLAAMGVDIAAVHEDGTTVGARGLEVARYRVDLVVDAADRQKLAEQGYELSDPPRDSRSRKPRDDGYEVYDDFDNPRDGILAQLQQLQAAHPTLTKLERIGRSLEGRPILAVRLTNERVRGDKPAVLFHATTHAREWVSTETAMRLMEWFLEGYGSDPRATELLDTREVWVVPVVNPDGYQYTFDEERLWRKNLRDNDGDGEVTSLDGVDLNRNFDSHWGYDDEGSSPLPFSETYRGTAPESEPETRALSDFVRSHDFAFSVSYHTYGNLILYPWGFQVNTESLDDEILVALAGTDANPAVPGYDPGVGADLYITNGEYSDWAYEKAGVPSYTVELTPGEDEANGFYGFEFPDDEAQVQQVFEDNLDFALSLVESAEDPAHPDSSVGITPEDVVHTPVAASYGPTQEVQVVARRSLDLSLDVDGTTVPFEEVLGERYNTAPGVYYSRYVATIDNPAAGASVTYRINADDAVLGPYEYTVMDDVETPILVMAAEDYTGANPDYADTSGPNYLSWYTDALTAGGYDHDVWDVDQQGVPSYQDVLSHYEVVLWYTGDDYAARVPDGLFTTDLNETRQVRDHLNYADGKLFATGEDYAWLEGAGFITDDFIQYYLGGDSIVMDVGDTEVVGVAGDPVLDGLSLSLTGGTGADNQEFTDTFLTNADNPSGGVLAGKYDRVGGPFDPHDGDWHVYSDRADRSYKRLGGTFTVPADDPTLRFWSSWDIEQNWDYGIVEVAPAGTDDWTTLPDLNGHTVTDTGDSCASGWVDELHPFLAHYQDAACNPTGSTGEWHGLTGSSGGWQQLAFDLSPWAGQDVELHISYVTDWATQNIGMFVDEVQLGTGPVESFETDLGAFATSTVEGSTPPPNQWTRQAAGALPEGPAIRTDDTVFFGFGFEGIADEANRNAVMARVIDYLGG